MLRTKCFAPTKRGIFCYPYPLLDAGDLKYLRYAVDLAWEGLGRNSPNPLVGCVIVKDGKVIGRGAHVYEKLAHAEAIALAEAGESARGATLYVNLEPCCHYGRTPPCTDSIIAAGVARVVYGLDDPFEKVNGVGVSTLADAGVRVEKCDDAVLISAMEDQNRFYLHHKRHGMPYVTHKAAASLDGRIATHTGESKWIAHTDALALAHLLRGVYDAVLIGANTARIDDPQLTYRPDEVGQAQLPEIIFPHTPTGLKSPLRVVIDADLNLSRTLRVFDTTLAPTVVVCSDDAYPEAADLLTAQGVEVIRVPKSQAGLDLTAALKGLAAKGIQSLLIEGGGDTAGRFYDAGLVDEVNLIYAPIIIGGRDAFPLVAGIGAGQLVNAKHIIDMRKQWVGQDLLVVGKVANRE